MSNYSKTNIVKFFFLFWLSLENVSSIDYYEISIHLGGEPCNFRESAFEFNLKGYETKFLVAIHTHGAISPVFYLNGLANSAYFNNVEAGQLTMRGVSQLRNSGAQLRDYILSINKNDARNKNHLHNKYRKKNAGENTVKKNNSNAPVLETNSIEQPFINLSNVLNKAELLNKFKANRGIFVTNEIFFQSPSQPRTNFAARAYLEGLFNVSKESLVNLKDLQTAMPHLSVQILSAAHNNDYGQLKIIQEKLKHCIKFLFNYNLLKSIKGKSNDVESVSYNTDITNGHSHCFDKILIEHFTSNACSFIKNYFKMFRKSIEAACSGCKKLGDVLEKSQAFVFFFLSQIYLAEKAAQVKHPLKMIHANLGEEEYNKMLDEFIYPDENLFSNTLIAKVAATDYLNFLNAWLIAKAYSQYDNLIPTTYALRGCEALIKKLVRRNNIETDNKENNENNNKSTADKLKFIFLSTHKSILTAILRVLNIYNWNVVPFGARLYVQLLEKTDQSSEEETEKMFEEIMDTNISDSKKEEEEEEDEVNEVEAATQASLNSNPFFFIDPKKVKVKEKKKRKRKNVTTLNEDNTKKNHTAENIQSLSGATEFKNHNNNNNNSTGNNTDKKYFVRILYGSPNIDLVAIKLPFCEERTMCKLSTWLEAIRNETRIDDNE